MVRAHKMLSFEQLPRAQRLPMILTHPSAKFHLDPDEIPPPCQQVRQEWQ